MPFTAHNEKSAIVYWCQYLADIYGITTITQIIQKYVSTVRYCLTDISLWMKYSKCMLTANQILQKIPILLYKNSRYLTFLWAEWQFWCLLNHWLICRATNLSFCPSLVSSLFFLFYQLWINNRILCCNHHIHLYISTYSRSNNVANTGYGGKNLL